MGELTVEISSDGTPSYPRGNTVYPNDTVTFQLVGSASGEVDVTFDPTNCCFTSSEPLSLDSSSLTASQQQKTVSGDARAKQYLFWTNPPEQEDSREPRPPPHWESKTGTLDVSTDPPPPPKE